MNILINLTSSQKNAIDPFHGGNEYANTICLELISTNNGRWKHNLFFFCSSEDKIGTQLANKIFDDRYSRIVNDKSGLSLNNALEQFSIERVFDPLGIEIGKYALENVEVIFTIHGLRPLEMPTDINEYYLESSIKHVLKRIFSRIYFNKVKRSFKSSIELEAKAKKLIAVSEHTKYSIISEFMIDPADISVLYSPEKAFPTISEDDENVFFESEAGLEKDRYYLIVSSKRWIKNTYRAIKAFNELISQGHIDYKIVLTGASDKVKRLVRNKKMYHVLDYVETGTLEILYKNAFALVYPSLNEGFGYPPLEAMKYGTPVVSAAITSIPEVVGDATLGFSPFSVIELKARILQLQNDKILYNRLVEQGPNRYRMLNVRQKTDLRKIVDIILS